MVAALPQGLASRVDHVEVVTVDQITLVMRDQREVLWGSAEESALKAEVVDKLLAAQEASYYDVSVPGQPAPTAPDPRRAATTSSTADAAYARAAAESRDRAVGRVAACRRRRVSGLLPTWSCERRG